jgi:hypothetical protein
MERNGRSVTAMAKGRNGVGADHLLALGATAFWRWQLGGGAVAALAT